MAPQTRMYEDVQNNHEALVMAHLGMVKRVALHLKVRIPPFMAVSYTHLTLPTNREV